MTTPTLREALEEIRGYCLMLPHPIPPSLLNKVDAALAAQPELPEPFGYVSDFKQAGIMSFQHKPWGDMHAACHSTVAVYTAAQLRQAVEQAQTKREPMSEAEAVKLFSHPQVMQLGLVGLVRAIEAHHNIGDKA